MEFTRMNESTEHNRPSTIPPGVTDDDAEIDTLPLYRKKRVLIPPAFLLLLTAGGVWYYYVQIKGFNSTDDAFVDGNRVSISSKILGRIIDLAADEGDSVL